MRQKFSASVKLELGWEFLRGRRAKRGAHTPRFSIMNPPPRIKYTEHFGRIMMILYLYRLNLKFSDEGVNVHRLCS